MSFFSGNYIDDYFNSNSKVYKQKYKIDQKQIQLQDQNNSNRLLMILLSSAENFASKLNKSLKREYYSHDFGQSFESKSINQILLQFIEQIETFESSYKRYCKIYNKYDFPYDSKNKNGLSKEEIIKDLKYWMNLVNEEYKKYYSAVIGIFNNKPIPNFDNDIEKIEGIYDKGKEDKCNPKILKDVYPILLEQGNSEKKQISKNYSNDKNYQIVINKRENNNNKEYEKKIKSKLDNDKMDICPIYEKSKEDLCCEKIIYVNQLTDLSDFIIHELKKCCSIEIDTKYFELYFKNNNSDNIYTAIDNFLSNYLDIDDKGKKIITNHTSKIRNIQLHKNNLITQLIDELYKNLTSLR